MSSVAFYSNEKMRKKKLNEIKIEKVYHFYAKAIATSEEIEYDDCCNYTLVRKSLQFFLYTSSESEIITILIVYMHCIYANIHTTYFNKLLDRFFFLIM